jgi:cation diffusion facilitator family transporter
MKGTKRTVIAALFGNLGIALFKYAAAFITGSASMLAEAYHSTSDTFNQLFLLLGMKLSKKEPDEQHPFGYGKEQFFWSFIVAVILFGVAGTLSIREGISKIGHPTPLHNLGWSFAAIFVGILLEGYALRFAFIELVKSQKEEKYPTIWKTIKHSKDPSLLTVFFEDTLAIAGLLVASIGIALTILTHNPVFDAIASLVIGILLMVFAFVLGYEVKKLIIGESISKRKKRLIRDAVESFDEVNKILSLKTMHLSSDAVIVAMEVKFKSNIDIREIEKINDKIEAKIKEIVPKAKCYIEPENKAD